MLRVASRTAHFAHSLSLTHWFPAVLVGTSEWESEWAKWGVLDATYSTVYVSHWKTFTPGNEMNFFIMPPATSDKNFVDLHCSVQEIQPGVEYRVEFWAESRRMAIMVQLGPDFPLEKPVLLVSPTVVHSWVDHCGRITAAPGLVNVSLLAIINLLTQYFRPFLKPAFFFYFRFLSIQILEEWYMPLSENSSWDLQHG